MTLAAIEAKTAVCKLHFKKVRCPQNIPALTEIVSRQKMACILGGNEANTKDNRYSYWAFDPVEIFEIQAGCENPFPKLNAALAKYKIRKDQSVKELPREIFKGGWAGFFCYELGKHIEKIPDIAIDDLQMPLVRLCFYDKVICIDRFEKKCWLTVLELPDDVQQPDKKLEILEKVITKSQEINVTQHPASNIEAIDCSKIRCNIDKQYYFNAFEKIKKHIYDGDVYQINFTRRFERQYNAKPIELYHWENFYNPSCYAAYIDVGKFHIVSASPEMFMTITDGVIKTKPIKGTRPRLQEAGNSESKAINNKNLNELLYSEKEKAELNMIIDLERNDLGRICQYGTIKLSQPRTIEAYPTVFHAAAIIEGSIREGINFCDILKAMFPGGSITGAPKVSAMEIIERLEPNARGVYTGAIGFISIDGSVCLNIPIRTIIIKNQNAFIQTGGGIVADSVAEDEWQETIVKARALLAGVKAVQENI